MDKSEAITSVDDAIRKLVQLSSKEKVWAQEVLLQVNDKSLRLLDVESQVLASHSGHRGEVERLDLMSAFPRCMAGVFHHFGLWKGAEPRAGREDLTKLSLGCFGQPGLASLTLSKCRVTEQSSKVHPEADPW
jgi:hypothetical protein